MPDLIKGLAGRFGFSLPWVFAAAIVIGSASVFLLPPAARLAGVTVQVTGTNVVTATLSLTLGATVVGFAMAVASTYLYRLLEGYAWRPKYLRELGVWWQTARKHELEREYNRLPAASSLERRLVLERLKRYPIDEGQIAPTLLGNALRAFETYGMHRYQLDSQALWSELYVVIPKTLQDEIAGSRVVTDIFVAMVYLTAVYGVLALGIAAEGYLMNPHQLDRHLLIEGCLVSFLGPWISYRFAVSSTNYWSGTVRAAVNLGRPRLVEAFGLAMPVTLYEERKMWSLLTRFVTYPYSDDVNDLLDAFRMQTEPSTRRSLARRCSCSEPSAASPSRSKSRPPRPQPVEPRHFLGPSSGWRWQRR